MKLTKTFAILPLALTGALAAGAANAQAMTFSGIDLNGDGKLDMAELESAFGANAQLALEQYDSNQDGIVEVDEAVEVASRGAVNAETGQETAMENAAEPAQDGLARAAEAIDAAEERQASVMGDVEADADIDLGASDG